MKKIFFSLVLLVSVSSLFADNAKVSASAADKCAVKALFEAAIRGAKEGPNFNPISLQIALVKCLDGVENPQMVDSRIKDIVLEGVLAVNGSVPNKKALALSLAHLCEVVGDSFEAIANELPDSEDATPVSSK